MNEEALVKDFLDLMTVLDQEEAMEIRTINIKYSVNLRVPTESLIYLFSRQNRTSEINLQPIFAMLTILDYSSKAV